MEEDGGGRDDPEVRWRKFRKKLVRRFVDNCGVRYNSVRDSFSHGSRSNATGKSQAGRLHRSGGGGEARTSKQRRRVQREYVVSEGKDGGSPKGDCKPGDAMPDCPILENQTVGGSGRGGCGQGGSGQEGSGQRSSSQEDGDQGSSGQGSSGQGGSGQGSSFQGNIGQGGSGQGGSGQESSGQGGSGQGLMATARPCACKMPCVTSADHGPQADLFCHCHYVKRDFTNESYRARTGWTVS